MPDDPTQGDAPRPVEQASLPGKTPRRPKTQVKDEAPAKVDEKTKAADHKRVMQQDQAAHIRWKERWYLRAGMATYLAAAGACLIIVLIPTYELEMSKAALAGLLSTVTAALGFGVGRASEKS